jgi:hypothetical protein
MSHLRRNVDSMRFIHWLFQLDGIVPYEVTRRRARSMRALAVILLVAAFPGVFIAYHQERLEPFVDRVTDQILEVAERRLSNEP